MRAASFLIKPASGRCNLACRYCFYHEVSERRTEKDFGLMSRSTAELLLERAFDLEAEEYSFAFQGGEPTLAGLDFYKHFVAEAHRLNEIRSRGNASPPGHAKTASRPPAVLRFSLQTNGILLNEDWARFLKREGFLIGISIDGPRLLHNASRQRADGSGSYAETMAGVELLRRHEVPMNALCVVNAAAADNAEAVYRHLRSRGFEWLQFIPCIDPLGEEAGGRPWSLSAAAYGRFLKTVFDLRYDEWRAGAPVNVRWIDNLIGLAMGEAPESCGMAGACAVNFVVEADGSVYPCDFYVTDEWRMGAIQDSSLSELLSSAAAKGFVEGSRHVDAACVDCFAFPLCRGGCRRDREPFEKGLPAQNRYCSAFRDFFAYAGSRIMEMAEVEASLRGAP